MFQHLFRCQWIFVLQSSGLLTNVKHPGCISAANAWATRGTKQHLRRNSVGSGATTGSWTERPISLLQKKCWLSQVFAFHTSTMNHVVYLHLKEIHPAYIAEWSVKPLHLQSLLLVQSCPMFVHVFSCIFFCVSEKQWHLHKFRTKSD